MNISEDTKPITTRSASGYDWTDKGGELGFQTSVLEKTKEYQISWSSSLVESPYLLLGIFHLLRTEVVPLVQMVHNKVGRLSLEAIDTWNTIFDGVIWFFSYDERSPRRYLHKHIKHIWDQRYPKIIYRSMSVTKKSDNNMQDYNITSIWERNQLCINKMKKEFTPMP